MTKTKLTSIIVISGLLLLPITHSSGNTKQLNGLVTIHSIIIDKCNDDDSCKFFFEIGNQKYPKSDEDYYQTENAMNISINHVFEMDDAPNTLNLKIVEHKRFESDVNIASFQIPTTNNFSRKMFIHDSPIVIMVLSLYLQESKVDGTSFDWVKILIGLLFISTVMFFVFMVKQTTKNNLSNRRI
ncbi:MAG: hypothetical protein HeimC2_00360 [Candidatus Heimdallarchaeota archaeon LC_2]|nr:MAG: hypothetical protein HeimC2_00360 [Candidatus Heimdallarchaeota archaeon LC_2]